MLVDTENKYNSNNGEVDDLKEGLSVQQKIRQTLQLFKCLFSEKAMEVLESHKEFTNIHFHDLHVLGKDGMILGIDGTIAPADGDILPENLEKIRQLLEEGWKIIVYSNAEDITKCEELVSLGIEVINLDFQKPDKRGFEECVNYFKEKHGLEKDQLLMVGNNVLTDGGAQKAGLDFVKVETIPNLSEVQSEAQKFQSRLMAIMNTAKGIKKRVVEGPKRKDTYVEGGIRYVNIEK